MTNSMSCMAAFHVQLNRSFDRDTRRQCAARRVDKPTPCGALSARAGQLRRKAQHATHAIPRNFAPPAGEPRVDVRFGSEAAIAVGSRIRKLATQFPIIKIASRRDALRGFRSHRMGDPTNLRSLLVQSRLEFPVVGKVEVEANLRGSS
jgi:hypothetical protein